ncbi:hypothetical protein BDY21DRAFT_364832 [Lineolata rhizophorae]|uniref:NACHT-NTPase and P-loop NTPases N-terminal domain-containing protein n=1 Tax=Lineolata rhizophorae TaxID=578093 RepID=A0A6A6NWZ7_9PEZI|nr:hypothetical protein BDY21DRAFT_364832 [Lineolata rhizophorae]
MDPVSAFGTTAGAMQILAADAQFVDKFTELYTSASGSLDDRSHQEKDVHELIGIATAIKSRSGTPGAGVSEERLMIIKLASAIEATGSDLLAILSTLKVNESRKGWSTLVALAKNAKADRKIQPLLKSLESHRSNLLVYLAAVNHEQQGPRYYVEKSPKSKN